MGDLFHEYIPFELVDVVYKIMARCPQHTFIILTKRALRMRAYYQYVARLGKVEVCELVPPENLWVGVTAETQASAESRIASLLHIPAKVLFVSVEPMLGEIDISVYLHDLDWVICGGETGAGARPMHPDWVRYLRDQCVAADVPFFFKQWGEWAPNCLCGTKNPHTSIARPNSGPRGVMFRCGKKRAGNKLDGREWAEFPAERLC